MLDLRHVLDNLDQVRARTAARRTDFDFDALEQLARERRESIFTYETTRAEQKRASDGMKQLKPGSDEFNALRAELRAMSDRLKELEDSRKAVEDQLQGMLMTLPNEVHELAPVGGGEDDNVLVREVGTRRAFDFTPRDHVDIGESLGILDQGAAAKVTGARFSFLRGAGARLERALINFMLDLHTREHGYEEFHTPYLVNADSLTGTGQLPKFEEDVFRAGPYYLIPTAEVPLTNFFRDTITEDLSAPIQVCAFTPCFRSEAGSHGRDTRGLIRQHQFDKVELVRICRPEDSEQEHERLLAHACRVLDLLELPYRVMELCTGDIGFAAARCYDIEVWLPSQERYREISSCSNFRDFQARRAGIRFRDANGKVQFAHTLNGSGLAVGRTWLAILENYQQEDGSVRIPSALQPWMGGLAILQP